MSNSATSAAKRRRAAPFMSNPLAPSSGNNNSQQQASFQNTQQGQSEPKLLTLQQVIALVDSRLTNLEKNVVEIKSQPSSENPEQQSDAIPEYNNEDIKQTVESIMYEYLKSKTGKKPILLLDDIFEKIDDQRSKQLMKMVCSDHFGQIFVSDTNLQRVQEHFEDQKMQCTFIEI